MICIAGPHAMHAVRSPQKDVVLAVAHAAAVAKVHRAHAVSAVEVGVLQRREHDLASASNHRDSTGPCSASRTRRGWS